MENDKTQLSEKLKTATNILVTVSNNPSVDQLTACLGMTLWLNKTGKHATAVFSGDIPNALEFLQPETTIEKNTDSLRDFIIALDKSKADKLRYKVEDRVVKIFITPYRTSLSSSDLEFSQGDFNVDAIVAIGVTNQADLDNAIVSHGRILHDATITTINTTSEGGIGSINWHEPTASSLSELVYDLCHLIDATQIDPQIATALLTGIVASTNRFSNNKTSSLTMSVASALMNAGANQQLVASKLEGIQSPPNNPEATANSDTPTPANVANESQSSNSDGALEISHLDSVPVPPKSADSEPSQDTQLAPLGTTELQSPEIDIANLTNDPLASEEDTLPEPTPPIEPRPNMKVVEPPTLEEVLGENEQAEEVNPPASSNIELPTVDKDQLNISSEPGSAPANETPVLNIPTKSPDVASEVIPEENGLPDVSNDQTLSEIETAVDSPHLHTLRDQVEDALKTGPAPDLPPTQALNAINVDLKPQSEPSSSVQANPLEFNPFNFGVDSAESDEAKPDDPPQVPPPIIPPEYLPPSPPVS